MRKGVFRLKSYTKYRVLTLLKDRKMSIAEIAEALGLARSTVKNLIRSYRRLYLIKPCGLKTDQKSGRKVRVWALTKRGLREIEKLRGFYRF